MKVLVPPKSHLEIFVAGWSSPLVQLSWWHSAIQGREPISKCGEMSTVCWSSQQDVCLFPQCPSLLGYEYWKGTSLSSDPDSLFSDGRQEKEVLV